MEIYGLKVDDFPPGVNARLFGSKTRLIIDRAGMGRRLLGDLVDRLVPVEISRSYYPKQQKTRRYGISCQVPHRQRSKSSARHNLYGNREVSRPERRQKKAGKISEGPHRTGRSQKKTIEDYISAVKYEGDMKEDREKHLPTTAGLKSKDKIFPVSKLCYNGYEQSKRNTFDI